MLIKEYKWRNGNGGETDIRELEDSHLKNIINYLGNEINKCNRELSYRGTRNSRSYKEDLNRSELINLKEENEETLKIMEQEQHRRVNEFVQSKSDKGNHKSSMSSGQRRMIADSLHSFNYDALQLVHTPDPKLYDVWKRETEKVQI
jgi:hypothetical protein